MDFDYLEQLSDISPIDRELSPDIQKGKGIRLDYHGMTESGRMVNLELQKDSEGYFEKRALYNAATIIHRQLLSGDDYDKICQTVFIGLLGFSMFKGEKRWYWDFILRHGDSGRVLTDDLLLIFVEVAKLTETLRELRGMMKVKKLDKDDPAIRLALWGGYFTGEGVDILSDVMESDKVFTEVAQAERDYWGDSRNRFLQMIEEKHERDAISAKRYAERTAVEKERVAMEKGLAEGRAEGKSEGKVEVARNLLARGVSPEIIAESAGLSLEQLRELMS